MDEQERDLLSHGVVTACKMPTPVVNVDMLAEYELCIGNKYYKLNLKKLIELGIVTEEK